VIEVPDTPYAVVGEDRVAFQVFGHGELDLLWVPPRRTASSCAGTGPPTRSSSNGSEPEPA
jgi:hypothetical protein